MANCFVIGGGFAGLSAAVHLANNNHKVKLIEASPKLGGRAYSFKHDAQNTIIDNGQHIMMGCYLFTLEFLELINSLDSIYVQPHLEINFVDRQKKKYKLDTGEVTYPFNILTALKDYDALSKSEKALVVKLFLKIAVCNPKHYEEISTKEFLGKNHQTENSINALWEIIHVGTMNCKMEESSAAIFIRILKEIFFTINNSTKIILPKVGLSEMYCDRSAEFLEGKGSEISLSEKLIKIEFSDESGKAKVLTTSKKRYTEFDYLVLAIPPDQLQKILPETEKYNLPRYEFSPILNIHLWLSENQFNERFYGLINSKIHWLFNNDKHITLVTSAADEFIPMSNEEILELVFKELSEYFEEFKSGYVIDHLIIKEKRATFKPTIENSVARQNLKSNYNNILFAGDWTNTGLPATIESAVKSGEAASDIISALYQKL